MCKLLYLEINTEKNKERNFAFDLKKQNKWNNWNNWMQRTRNPAKPIEVGHLELDDLKKLLLDNKKNTSKPWVHCCINVFSIRSKSPREKVWNAIKRGIHYAKTTKRPKTNNKKWKKPILATYANADWVGDKSNRK